MKLNEISNKKVFVVYYENYYDSSVVGVFDSKPAAEKAIKTATISDEFGDNKPAELKKLSDKERQHLQIYEFTLNELSKWRL